MLRRVLALASFCALSFAAGEALACTTVLVGPGATRNGALIVARNADSDPMRAQRVLFHPASSHAGKPYVSSGFTYPEPAASVSFTTVPYWKTGLHGAAGFNALGVGISATETIYAKDEVLALDPYERLTGITEDDIPDVILPRAKSARQAARLLGEIVEKRGAGEGFGVAFVDAKEAWYLEAATGHLWVAARLPDDSYFASANQARLEAFAPGDPDWMGARNLIDWCVRHRLYDPKKGAFNYAGVFARNDAHDVKTNRPRVWQVQRRLTPSVKRELQGAKPLPVFARPDRKVALREVFGVLGDHYEHTAFDPYAQGADGDRALRPVSVFSTYESHVLEVRPGLPAEIGCVMHLAMGMSALSLYVPFYQGFTEIPKAYATGSDKADAASAYWRFRRVQTLAMTDYPRLAPVVRKTYGAYYDRTHKAMRAFEREYLDLAGKDRAKARSRLQAFNAAIVEDALATAAALEETLFGIRTRDFGEAAARAF